MHRPQISLGTGGGTAVRHRRPLQGCTDRGGHSVARFRSVAPAGRPSLGATAGPRRPCYRQRTHPGVSPGATAAPSLEQPAAAQGEGEGDAWGTGRGRGRCGLYLPPSGHSSASRPLSRYVQAHVGSPFAHVLPSVPCTCLPSLSLMISLHTAHALHTALAHPPCSRHPMLNKADFLHALTLHRRVCKPCGRCFRIVIYAPHAGRGSSGPSV